MSSKKQRRQQRRRQDAEKPRFNPATAFILAIVAALLVVGIAAAVIGSDPTPPRPGAVWSAEHGHWH